MKRFILIVWFLLLASSAPQAGYQEGFAAHEAGDYVTALREWRPLAEGGDARAQHALGVMYADGLGVEKDNVTAAKWFRKAAQGGDAMAQSNLGFDYYLGRGVEQDFAKAHEWLSRAVDGLPPGDAREKAKSHKGLTYKFSGHVERAEAGDALSQTFLGVLFAVEDGPLKDYSKAAKWLRLAAEQGQPQAQYYLGRLYVGGYGVPQDYKEAAKWYLLAAENNDEEARKWKREQEDDCSATLVQAMIGDLYYRGEKVPQNYMEAGRWLKLAADRGNPKAQLGLGLMHWRGRGVPKDHVLAHMWFNLAAAQIEDKEAAEARDEFEQLMTTAQITEAQKLAREWKPKGCEIPALSQFEFYFSGGR